MSERIPQIYTVQSMFASRQEALQVAKALIEKRLAACVNVIEGVTSVYRWEGALQQEPEVMLLAKTTKNRCDAAIDEIKRLHSYDLPCIMASPADGFVPFMQWVAEETAG